MGATGSAILDFGTPSKPAASIAVTGQAGIVATSKTEAFVRLAVSTDHSVDEHRIEQLKSPRETSWLVQALLFMGKPIRRLLANGI